MENTLLSKQFYNFWSKLPERVKVDRLHKVLRSMNPIIEKQLLFIRKLKNPIHEKRGVYFWIFTIVESFWEEIGYILNIGKRKNRHHAVVFIRIALEKMVKLGYLRTLNEEKQEKLVEKEISKIAFRLYKEALASGEDGEEYRVLYDKNCSDKNLSIDQIKFSDVNPFPEKIEVMIQKSGLPDSWYSHYRYLSEVEHGGLIYQFMRSENKDSEYRRSLMLLIPICYKMLEWTDIILGIGMSGEIKEMIKNGEGLTKKGMVV